MAGARDATIIVFDVGANTNEFDATNSTTFYEQAKRCIEAILTRKIFTRPKDDVALYLIGTNSTDNALNTEKGGYDHINQALTMEPVNWDILKYVKNDIDPPTDVTADWLDAIVVAMDYFNTLNLKKCKQKILLFTTFSTEVCADNVTAVIEGLKQMEIELIVVTRNVIWELDPNSHEQFGFSQSDNKDQVRAKNERLIMKIVQSTDGALCGLDEAVYKQIYMDKKQRRRVPWNCDLTIGSKLSVKISAYIYVRDDKEIGTWRTRAPSGEACVSRIEHYHNEELIDPEVVAENLIKGYLYGGVSVPFEDANKESGTKGLRCLGFTDISNIRMEYLKGDTIWLVIPQKGFEFSSKCYSALMNAMGNMNVALIAHYTYRDGTAPKMMAIFASDDSMHMYELFFKDNIIDTNFPLLNSKSTAPSAEQLDFMDKFIDSMDLVAEHDLDRGFVKTTEQFKPLLDPGLQNMYRVIANRAINPKDPVLKPHPDIMVLITPQKQPDVDGLKTLFPLKPIKLTNKEKLLQNLSKANEDAIDEPIASNSNQNFSEISEIGTIRPAEDFMDLWNQGKGFDELSKQIEKVIADLVMNSMICMNDKVIPAMFAYRETARLKAAYKYNEWITEFKQQLIEREKHQLWQLIVDEQLGLITAEESKFMVLVSSEDALAFYKIDEQMTKVAQPMETNGDDDDLFDDL